MLNEQSKKVKAISANGLTKVLVDKFSIVNGGKYFSSGIFQNYLVFIPANKYNKYFTGISRIQSWKSNGMSEESIEKITKSGTNFAPTFIDHHSWPDIFFNWHCLIKNNTSISKKIIDRYISYTLGHPLRNLKTDFTKSNCLFGFVKLTKNADTDNCKYSGYGIGFDSRSEFSGTDRSYGKDVIIFGADMSSSAHGKKIKISYLLVEDQHKY